jgi:hypothetical protein
LFHIGVKLLRERVGVVNVKNPLEKVYINANIQIFPCIIIGQLSDDPRNLLPFQKYSLRDSRVLNFWLCNEKCLICQVIVYQNFSNSVILEPAFDNMLLEIGIKSENFSVVLEPWWLYSGNVIVLRSPSFF